MDDTYNCGGYALGTNTWFNPYGYDADYRDELIYQMYVDGVSRKEIRDTLLLNDIEYLTHFFNGKLKQVNFEDVDVLEDLICYRISVIINEDDEDYPFVHSDFHFKVRKNGEWSEKIGFDEPKKCKLMAQMPWYMNSTVIYDSEPVYFTLEK